MCSWILGAMLVTVQCEIGYLPFPASTLVVLFLMSVAAMMFSALGSNGIPHCYHTFRCLFAKLDAFLAEIAGLNFLANEWSSQWFHLVQFLGERLCIYLYWKCNCKLLTGTSLVLFCLFLLYFEVLWYIPWALWQINQYCFLKVKFISLFTDSQGGRVV